MKKRVILIMFAFIMVCTFVSGCSCTKNTSDKASNVTDENENATPKIQTNSTNTTDEKKNNLDPNLVGTWKMIQNGKGGRYLAAPTIILDETGGFCAKADGYTGDYKYEVDNDMIFVWLPDHYDYYPEFAKYRVEGNHLILRSTKYKAGSKESIKDYAKSLNDRDFETEEYIYEKN